MQNHGDAADLAEAATQDAAVVDGFEEVAVVEDLQAALARKDQELQANAKELHANANELQANAKELQEKDFFKQKTAYEMESRDWSSDVCSSD
eukprot:COSAG05_NODE_16140_length_353_cov_0.322835_1_plen_92_part_10